MDLTSVTDELRAFVREREWDQYHNAKNLSMLLSSEAGELLALLRWVKEKDSDEEARGRLRAKVEAELGDVGIAWLLLCARVGVDPSACVRRKLATNRENYPVATSRGVAERPTTRE